MKKLLAFKKHIGGTLLFFLLFSANVLLYSTHFVEEFGHDAHKIASQSNGNSSVSAAIPVVNHQHDDDKGTHHGDGESCCDSHSHASVLYPPVSFKHSPRLISHLTGEPFKFIPEVYLDKFIPPAEPRLKG